jgi:leucyl-tRNA synthetase
MIDYDPQSLEKKWQKRWEDEKAHLVNLSSARRPFYTHTMFPYPSGDKLHIGHWYNYSGADMYARFKRMQGYDVLSPMGFDAFGLPAENYAIKTGTPPAESTGKNVETMIRQLKRIGCMYDWNRMVNTSHPEYYQWTQWLFLQMLKHDLAYRKAANVNWCPSCQTVLANEQVWEGQCERCDSPIVLKPMTQWYWRVTKYAQTLLDHLEGLEWPEKTKTMQRNWIGRSEGVNFRIRIKGTDHSLEVFDSVPQTFMAQTFAVIAPEHPLLPELVKGTGREAEVMAFIERVKVKKATEKYNFMEDLEGVFTGHHVEFPSGNLPLWVASFVVMEYGSGIVNCSAHDERDFAFAKKYGIPLNPVMFPEDPEEADRVRKGEVCYAKADEGVLQQPEEFRGRHWGEVREDIIDFIEKKGYGRKAVHYRLRDWCISRQRYWGALIPVVYDPEGNPHAVPEEHLPWMLPTDVEFKPTGHSPIADSKELQQRVETIFGRGWRPEVDTMDTFVCSSFYSYMYLGADHTSGAYRQRPLQSGSPVEKEIEEKWMPVQMYIGGAEHACMHLIYARYVSMVMKELGFVSHDEQYQRLVHQGVITNKGAKMSKSKGNVVSPDGFVDRYGSDVFRMYLMFMGPFTQGGDWSDTGIKGVSRFVQRIWRVFSGMVNADLREDAPEVSRKLHQTIRKVTDDIERLHFNTALSALMEFMNLVERHSEGITPGAAKSFTLLLAPLAPHLAEELWEALHADSSGKEGDGFVIDQAWPECDASLLVSETVTIAVQVNGKLRATIEVPAGITESEAVAIAKEQENVRKHMEGKTPKKEIYVPGKLVSIVV